MTEKAAPGLPEAWLIRPLWGAGGAVWGGCLVLTDA